MKYDVEKYHCIGAIVHNQGASSKGVSGCASVG